jgi:hypothetical protein
VTGDAPCREGLNQELWIAMKKDSGIGLLENLELLMVSKMKYWCGWRRGFEGVEEPDELSYRELDYRKWRQIMIDENYHWNEPSALLMLLTSEMERKCVDKSSGVELINRRNHRGSMFGARFILLRYILRIRGSIAAIVVDSKYMLSSGIFPLPSSWKGLSSLFFGCSFS